MFVLFDVGIVIFCKWLDEFVGGKFEWEGVIEIGFKELNDEELYDCWYRYIKYCFSCWKFLILIEKI